jgi:opacity protein-like surface antigen
MRRFSIALGACTALLLATAPTLDAQTIGFKLGASMSKMVTDPDNDLDGLTAFAGGGFVRFGFGRIGIQPELLTVTRGYDDDSFGSLKLEYIEIPVLIHLPLSLGTSFSPYVVAGPSLGIEVGCEVEFGDIEGDCDDEGGEGDDDRSSTDIGITAGGGLAFNMGPGALLLEGRYTWGLTDLSDVEGVSTKSRWALLTVGYAIPLSR